MNLAEFRQSSVPICQSAKRFNKVFGIGANKTGTSTLQAIFQIIGLNVAPQQQGETLGLDLYRGNFIAFSDYVRQYDAFQDAPFSVKTTYAQVDALFPGSKFILTHREPEIWFNSLLNFHKKLFRCDAAAESPSREEVKRDTYILPGYLAFMAEVNWLLDVDPNLGSRIDWDLGYQKDHYISLYVQRNQAIVRHFSERPRDLLVIDITREVGTHRIIEFLELPDMLVTSVPHVNKT
ncbi:MAG: hypothetical protein HY847_03560 [Betaproteobacteria bacterium]|nr:hypothetical protein [Betaproteobacteria bacterium]